MITPDDISALVLARYTATAAFGTAVPGGGWFGRGPDTPTAYPYAVHQIEPDPAITFTADLYVHKFTVKVAAYAPVGASGVNPQNVALAIFGSLCTTAAQTAFQAASMRNATEKVLHARPVAPRGEFAEKLREARDVFVCGLAVELLCQGDKSVA
jgi:hypothetical protein